MSDLMRRCRVAALPLNLTIQPGGREVLSVMLCAHGGNMLDGWKGLRAERGGRGQVSA